MIKRIPADYRNLSTAFGLDPVAIRVLVNRGYDTEDKIRGFLSADAQIFDNTKGLPNLDEAISSLKRFRDEGRKVRIIGDYDIDGVCSTAILLKALGHFGMDVDYVIPHRLRDGYGMNASLIESAHEDGITGIITCDNGISAYEAVELANSLGIEVVITDHHEVPELIPNALAVVDPKRSENTYPNPDICGAFVAYKVISALLWGNREVSDDEQNLKKELMVLAGFATVGDVMPLNYENRGLVRFCLDHLKDGLNPGMMALIRETGQEERKLSSFSIGFILGPCINATGRLDSASNALELLMCRDEAEAKRLATVLHDMNEERKDYTAQGVEHAIKAVEAMEEQDRVLVLYLPEIHESIVGIVAGRVKEAFHRPTLVFTDVEEGMLKGSGRSVEGYDMFEKLTECSDLLSKFGGHPMAAGVSLEKKNLEALREFLNAHAGLSEEDLNPVLYIDADMPFSYATEELIKDLEKLEPYGSQNEKPVFARKDVLLFDGKQFGKNKEFAAFWAKEAVSGDRIFKLKMFRGLTQFHEYLDETYGAGTSEKLYSKEGVRLKVAFYPDLNEFRGEKSVEFMIVDYQ